MKKPNRDAGAGMLSISRGMGNYGKFVSEKRDDLLEPMTLFEFKVKLHCIVALRYQYIGEGSLISLKHHLSSCGGNFRYERCSMGSSLRPLTIY